MHEPVYIKFMVQLLGFDSRLMCLNLSSGEHAASYPVGAQNFLPSNKGYET